MRHSKKLCLEREQRLGRKRGSILADVFRYASERRGRRVEGSPLCAVAGDGGLPGDSKAQAEQVRTVDAGRVGERVGQLSPSSVRALDAALRLHLAL